MKRQPPSLKDLKPLRQPPKSINPSQLKTLMNTYPTKPEEQQIRQTPHFINHQPATQSTNRTPLSKNIRSLHHQSAVTINSINFDETVPGGEISEAQSHIINFPNRDTENRPTILNHYLSVTSLQDEFQYRPSKNTLNRIQHRYSFEEGNSGDKCRQCQYEGQMDKIYKLGWVAWSWIVFLIFSTVILFFIPLVVKSFQEKQLICPQCGYRVKTQNPTCL